MDPINLQKNSTVPQHLNTKVLNQKQQFDGHLVIWSATPQLKVSFNGEKHTVSASDQGKTFEIKGIKYVVRVESSGQGQNAVTHVGIMLSIAHFAPGQGRTVTVNNRANTPSYVKYYKKGANVETDTPASQVTLKSGQILKWDKDQPGALECFIKNDTKTLYNKYVQTPKPKEGMGAGGLGDMLGGLNGLKGKGGVKGQGGQGGLPNNRVSFADEDFPVDTEEDDDDDHIHFQGQNQRQNEKIDLPFNPYNY